MKVLLVGGYRGVRNYSMDAYLHHMATILEPHGAVCTKLFPEVSSTAMKAKGGFAKKWLGYFDQFVLFPKTLKRAAAEHDLVHLPDQGNAPFLTWLNPSQTVVTVHDLLAIRAMLGELPYWQVGKTGKAYQNWILKSLRKARNFPCVSTATAEDVRRLLPGDRLNASVVPTCCFQTIKGERREADPPYIHNVSHAQPYKNRLGALEIGSLLIQKPGFEKHRLKLMGGEATEEISAIIASSPAKDRIDVEPHPSTEQLFARVLGSSLLLFPSWDEGFGLPILEAQSAGVAVATTAKAPMSEVGGSACIYIEPKDPELSAQLIADRWSEREDLVQRGFKNLERFNPKAEGEGIYKAYLEALK